MLGSCWGHFGVIIGVILGSFWNHFGIILGLFCNKFGIILEPVGVFLFFVFFLIIWGTCYLSVPKKVPKRWHLTKLMEDVRVGILGEDVRRLREVPAEGGVELSCFLIPLQLHT